MMKEIMRQPLSPHVLLSQSKRAAKTYRDPPTQYNMWDAKSLSQYMNSSSKIIWTFLNFCYLSIINNYVLAKVDGQLSNNNKVNLL